MARPGRPGWPRRPVPPCCRWGGGAFFDPVLNGKPGGAGLAGAPGAPVLPRGVGGTELVWPRASRLPNVTNVLHPPDVSVSVGPPVALAGDDAESDTERIMGAI